MEKLQLEQEIGHFVDNWANLLITSVVVFYSLVLFSVLFAF